MSFSIAGVVVLYNPDSEVLNNLRSYCNSISKLYIVDNSECPSEELIVNLKLINAEYIPFNQNQGIAKALNIGASRAIEDGFDWLLTMDQDSEATKGMVQELINSTGNFDRNSIGIVSPQHILDSKPVHKSFDVEEVTVVMTSGNLLNLKAYQKVGPFRDDFFIDYVDHEYCLRLKYYGYKILVNHKAILNHQLGQNKAYNALGKTVTTTHHNCTRRYYITRNRLQVLKEYKELFPEYYKTELRNNIKELIKVFFFENNKFGKLKSIIRGYKDYRKGKFGKL
ncbi:glycosyltransferase family 2 protein [Pontibacter cellulosilyticus]|uniref:Glycosyltransferase family 2 protein n=1 Tax=Pontibacter cellulosilyticus TaxID=1720253 RepID=A0A923SHW0_9BACT|nr:glycosyltransferase family 2 protein [Pontibacter cellulosilyticus]MBC5992108.1 glycosyltransferase family 2 protein [Pontibacter cellulosilyticus]